jgi:hypothetical protein
VAGLRPAWYPPHPGDDLDLRTSGPPDRIYRPPSSIGSVHSIGAQAGAAPAPETAPACEPLRSFPVHQPADQSLQARFPQADAGYKKLAWFKGW